MSEEARCLWTTSIQNVNRFEERFCYGSKYHFEMKIRGVFGFQGVCGKISQSVRYPQITFLPTKWSPPVRL